MAQGKKTGGRKAGVPNKVTMRAREAVAELVEGNVPRLEGWLDQIAADPKQGPKVAFDCVMSLLEYHVPKLARTELTGKDGAELQPAVVIHQHVSDKNA